ncbi:MAG: PEP-CTERM sorting domain-containing protein [Deltaproteobacteria bacterium]|nr:PEP-CTERM sorting domain-containing protein [Deltaproteobacteria bacterium]
MKKLFLSINLLALLIFGLVSSAAALSQTDVGSLDQLFAVTTLDALGGNSSETAEASWVSEMLGITVEASDIANSKVEFGDDPGETPYNSFFTIVDDGRDISGDGTSDQWAFDLIGENSAFLLKTGTGQGGGSYQYWLFLNLAESDYATFLIGNEYYSVFDDVDGATKTITLDISNIESVSHVSLAPAPVPEPSTILLLGGGLLGLGIYGRKRGKK